MTIDIKDYLNVREHQPNGLNILDALYGEVARLKEENKALKEMIATHEERLNNLTLNIPEGTVNAIIARTLHMHAQVLIAATNPQPAPQMPQMVEEVEEEETAELEETDN